MSVSLGSRRRDKTPASVVVQQHSSAPRGRVQQQQQQQQLGVRKQRSFIDTGSGDFLAGGLVAASGGRREFLRRDLSVGRSFDGGRPRAGGFVSERRKFVAAADLQRQYSVDQVSVNPARGRKGPLKARYFGSISRLVGGEAGVAAQRTSGNDGRVLAWSSTSSLLKALDEELAEVNVGLDRKVANPKKAVGPPKSYPRGSIKLTSEELRKPAPDSEPETLAVKSDANRINLSIVLSQTIEATTENDVDSASESTEVVKHTPNKVLNSAQNRRAQFHISGGHLATTAATATTATTPATSAANAEPTKLNPATNNFNVVPLTIQRRPPLVRAMSAPVRAISAPDDNNKAMIAANKRKNRRRKMTARSVCCGKDEEALQEDKEGALLGEFDPKGSGGGGKKILTRSRSALASDVITLVSMVSSEGSDSERDDGELLTGSSTTSPARRAPLLRKAGKSVSFQENDFPNIQFSAKEFPNIIRRGSIAPLAARIRANRPPTAPPVSIFYSDAKSSVKSARTPANTESTSTSARNPNGARDPTSMPNEKENDASNNGKESPIEDEAPDYVRTIKERECWKLFQKMSTKGVKVTYDTILRGMLTPTEFRQLQKHRELEEAKARKAEEEEAAAAQDATTKTPTAIERLSEVLLKK